MVTPGGALEKKESTTKTVLPAPIKAGETKSASIRLNVSATTQLRFFDCEKKQISETTVSDKSPIKVTVQ